MNLGDSWKCRARTRKVVNPKNKKIVLEPCEEVTPLNEPRCGLCGSPRDPNRTLSGDLLETVELGKGDIVSTPDGWHRSVKSVEAGAVTLYSDERSFDAVQLKRLWPLHKDKD